MLKGWGTTTTPPWSWIRPMVSSPVRSRGIALSRKSPMISPSRELISSPTTTRKPSAISRRRSAPRMVLWSVAQTTSSPALFMARAWSAILVPDDVEDAARRERHDRRARGERLDTDHPEVVFRRKYEPASGGEQVLESGVIGPAGEGDVLACDPLEGAALASLADDHEPHAEIVERADRDIGAIVCGESSDEEPEVPTFI